MTWECRHILVRGVVQGVGFRPFVYRIAHERQLAGSVRNLGDAGVEILIEGPDSVVAEFLDALRMQVPPLARIDGMDIRLSEPSESIEFVILPSTQDGGGAGQLPPDVATCDACVAEILEPSRFTGYWATSCTDCGPRFTVIESLPYDRPRTSMSEFPMCDACAGEYVNPLDRRYHAQTTACDTCGPVLQFDGAPIDAVSRAIQALSHGRILAIKGIGGTHIACDAMNEMAVKTLRSRLGRFTQPFALMAREDMLSTLVAISTDESEEMRQPYRPILVLHKKDGAALDAVAPHLHTVGVMLPYSGLHHLLLRALSGPLVMTSANMPGRPMLIDSEKITTELQGIVDHTLLHDRRIVARCDDSVRRKVGGRFVFLRRSRGFVPEGLERHLGDAPILALGPESDLTFALYDRGRITLSQHIGTVDDLETLSFLESAIEHLRGITRGALPRVIACDAHPQFLTTQLAQQLAEVTDARVVRVQHHVAHLASVMIEHELASCVGIIADGYGYGMDGSAWGGEVFEARHAKIKRVASLLPVLMPGGDVAARQPLRMAASLLLSSGREKGCVADGLIARGMNPSEVGILLNQWARAINSPLTSSAGRFLDAVAAWVGICNERSYEGEPAMRLEAAAVLGEVIEIPFKLTGSPDMRRLDVVDLFARLDQLSKSASIYDVAATAQESLARGLASLAIHRAEEQRIEAIVLSGGVAYNDHFCSRIREIVESAGHPFFTNQHVPCGDGGVALGQLAAAGLGYRLMPDSEDPLNNGI